MLRELIDTAFGPPPADAVDQLALLGQTVAKRPTPEPVEPDLDPLDDDDPLLDTPAWEPATDVLVRKRAAAVAAHLTWMEARP